MNTNRKKTKRKLNVSVFVKRCLFCCVLIYLCFSLIFQQFDFARLSAKERDLDAQLADAQKEATELAAEKEASDTDEYLERIAREKLGYMKPSEKVFVDSSK